MKSKSQNLALLRDCGDNCIEVYGRYVEKHPITCEHLRCNSSDEKMPPESEIKHLRQ